MQFCNGIAVITGSAHGIGHATAETFLSNGYAVHGLDINDCKIDHPLYYHHICDLINDELPTIDGISHLINCMDLSDKDATYNLKAITEVSKKYAYQNNIEAVVNVAPIHWSDQTPEYSACRIGIIAYTKSLAEDMIQYKATANSICPSGVITDTTKDITDDKAKWKDILAQTPLKRWSSDYEIAKWILFIATVNRSMTGQNLVIDNGESL